MNLLQFYIKIINYDFFLFFRSRLRELENESEKLDESFRAYLKKQRLEKTQFNEDIAKILQSYNIRKAILGQHTPVRRTLTFNFDKNIAHPFQNADLIANNKSNENDILNSGHSGVDDTFENPFRAYGKGIEPKTLNNTINLGEITKLSEISSIDAHKEPMNDVQLDNEKMARHSETIIPAILITDQNNNSKKNTNDLLPPIDIKEVSKPTNNKRSEQEMQLKSLKENSIRSLNLSIPNIGLTSTTIISEKTNEFSDESSEEKYGGNEIQKLTSKRNDLIADLNTNGESKSVDVVTEQENIFHLNSPIDGLHSERNDLISKLNRSHSSISNWKENLGKSMCITTSSSSSDQQDSQSDGQISTGPPKSPSPNDSW